MTLRLIKLHLTPAHSSPLLVRVGWSEKQLPADIGQVGMQIQKGDLPFPAQLCLSQVRLTRLTWRFWLWIFSFHWMCWRLPTQIYSLQKCTYIFTGANISLYEWTPCVSPACPVRIPKGKWFSLLDVLRTPWLIPRGRGCNIFNSDLHHQSQYFQRLQLPGVWLRHLLCREEAGPIVIRLELKSGHLQEQGGTRTQSSGTDRRKPGAE